MKRLLVVVGMMLVLAAAGCQRAHADGLPYRGSKIVADLPPQFAWTGLYIGAGAGYSWGDNRLTLDHAEGNLFDINGLSSHGWKGDLKGGFDYRFAGTPIVLGVFGTWVPDGFGDHEFNASAMDGFYNVHATISPKYSAGARVGLVMANNSLIYVGAKHQWAEFSANLGIDGGTVWSTSRDLKGWGGVAGIEMPLTVGALQTTFGIEYGYQQYDRFTVVEGEGMKLDLRPIEHSIMGRINIRTGLFGN